MLQESFFYGSQLARPGRRANRGLAGRRPRFEALEDRCLLSFTPAVNYPVGAGPQAVVTADFNNDGHLDLATANPVSGTGSVLLGDGAGGFGDAIESNVGAAFAHNDGHLEAGISLTVADFDHDGHLDLAMASYFSNYDTGDFYGGLGVNLGNGDGTFRAATSPFNFPGVVQSVVAGDFNNDGNSDLAVSYYGVSFFGEYFTQREVLLGNDQGGFTAAGMSGYAVGGDALLSPAVGDLNRDGNLDVVLVLGAGGDGGDVLRGDGTGWLYLRSYYSTNTNAGAVAIGDFTGDGIPDLVVACSEYIFAYACVDLVTGRGDGTFNSPTTHSANGNIHTGVAVADFNGDGKLDVVTSDGDTGTVSLLLGNGDGTLRYIGAFDVGSSPMGVAVGDFNGDGRPDVAAVNGGSNNVSVLLNDGNWSVEPIAIGDYNRDSTVDAADYVVWRKTQGTMVTPSSGADGNGDGMVDQSDYGVWQSRFGQMASPPAAGSGVNAAGEIEAQAAEATGVREQTNLGTSQVGKTKSAVQMRRASEKQPAMMVRQSAFVELLDRPPTSLVPIRLSVRSPLGARAAHEASRRDDAVLMWVPPDSKQAVNDWQSGKTSEDKEADIAGDAFFESIDEVFSLLASD
jgi:hypothetical protein